MRILKHQTEIQGTEQLRLLKVDDDFIELEMSAHPLDGRPPISVVLSKEGLLDLIQDLQKIIER